MGSSLKTYCWWPLKTYFLKPFIPFLCFLRSLLRNSTFFGQFLTKFANCTSSNPIYTDFFCTNCWRKEGNGKCPVSPRGFWSSPKVFFGLKLSVRCVCKEQQRLWGGFSAILSMGDGFLLGVHSQPRVELLEVDQLEFSFPILHFVWADNQGILCLFLGLNPW